MKEREALQKALKAIDLNKELVEYCKKKAQAITEFADSKLPSLEPNQTEAEKLLEKAYPVLFKPSTDVKKAILAAMEEYASLARKQVIEEIEGWIEQNTLYSPIWVNDVQDGEIPYIDYEALLKYLQTPLNN